MQECAEIHEEGHPREKCNTMVITRSRLRIIYSVTRFRRKFVTLSLNMFVQLKVFRSTKPGLSRNAHLNRCENYSMENIRECNLVNTSV